MSSSPRVGVAAGRRRPGRTPSVRTPPVRTRRVSGLKARHPRPRGGTLAGPVSRASEDATLAQGTTGWAGFGSPEVTR